MSDLFLRKKDLLKLLNTILEVTECREICRQCNVGGSEVRIGTRTYGAPRGGCCRECEYLTDTGCTGKIQRSLICTLYRCDLIGKRLEEFGLREWFHWMWHAEPVGSHRDFRNPYALKSTHMIKIPEPRR